MAVSAVSAFAGGGYANGGVAGESTGGGSGSLPFTGAELALYVVVGLGYLTPDLVPRRRTGSPPD